MSEEFRTTDKPLHRELAERLATVTSPSVGDTAVIDPADHWQMLDQGAYCVVEKVLPLTRFSSLDDVEHIANEVERSTGIGPVNIRNEISGVFYELALNAVQHSESAIGEYAVLQCAMAAQGEVIYAVGVADRGIGIPASLRRNPEYAYVESDTDAIALATELHVTGTKDPYRGLGLDHVVQVVKSFGGNFVIISGGGYWNLEKGIKIEKGSLNSTDRLSGTVAAVTVSVPAAR